MQVDEGQAGPRFVRPTTVMVPGKAELATDAVPFGLIVQPLAEMSQAEYNNAEECLNGEVPQVDLRQVEKTTTDPTTGQ